MGIYIKNMKMPKSCTDCVLFRSCEIGRKLYSPGIKGEDIIYMVGSRDKDCPLVEIVLEDKKE